MSAPERGTGGGIPLPAPTAWPMIAAFGVALMAAGLVTFVAVSVVGLVLALAGAIGWGLAVFPEPQEVEEPLLPPERRARPVEPRPEAVSHLRAGEEGHRVRLPVEVRPYGAGVRAGLAGGVAMAVVALGYGVLVRGSPWLPINLLSSIAMPSLQQADAATLAAYDGAALLLAVFLHALLSVLAGLVYAAALPMLPRHPVLLGGVVAPLLWSGVAYFSLRIVAPPLDAEISWPWFLASQLAFGVVAGLVILRTEPVRPGPGASFADRAGLEGPRESDGGDSDRGAS